MGTCKEQIAKQDVRVLASLRVHYIYYFERHESGNSFSKDEGGGRPGEHFNLSRYIYQEYFVIFTKLLVDFFNFLYDLFRLRGK
jgi:hypothetical protein